MSYAGPGRGCQQRKTDAEPVVRMPEPESGYIMQPDTGLRRGEGLFRIHL